MAIALSIGLGASACGGGGGDSADSGGEEVSYGDVVRQAEAAGVPCQGGEDTNACAAYVQKVCGKGGDASEAFCERANQLIRDYQQSLARETQEASQQKAEAGKAAEKEAEKKAEKPTGPVQEGEVVGGRVSTIGLQVTIRVRLKDGRVVTARIDQAVPPSDQFEVGAQVKVQPTGNGWVWVPPFG